MSLSTRLQGLRKKYELSQEQLAEKIGVSRQSISKWESEQSNPDLDNIIKLSEIYDISIDYILRGGEPTVVHVGNRAGIDNRNIRKIKLFESIFESKLGKKVNSFLAKKEIKVLGLQYPATVFYFSLMIVYEEDC